MNNLKTFENFNQEQLAKPIDPVSGDIVLINYEIPGGKKSKKGKNKRYIDTPVKILNIIRTGNGVLYNVTHNVEGSSIKNAPDHSIRRYNIKGLYKGIDTPVGPGWFTGKPSSLTGNNQVSNDMYL
jgi:hypothetical protein